MGLRMGDREPKGRQIRGRTTKKVEEKKRKEETENDEIKKCRMMRHKWSKISVGIHRMYPYERKPT